VDAAEGLVIFEIKSYARPAQANPEVQDQEIAWDAAATVRSAGPGAATGSFTFRGEVVRRTQRDTLTSLWTGSVELARP